MKKGYFAIALVVALSFAVSAILIPMMPETVPVHFNIHGEADRIGSRYEMLIFPGFSVVMGVFMALMARSRKTESEKKVLLVTGVMSSALFMVLGAVFGIIALRYDSAAANMADTYRIIAALIGLTLIVLGNYMPKVGLNSVFGLRTHWSMKNAETWRKSQRFGGISGVICGFILLICSVFLSGNAMLTVLLSLVVIWSAVAIYMTYRYAKN